MLKSELNNFKRGEIYKVKIKGQKNTVKRMFFGLEKRFGEIPCACFSSAIRRGIFNTSEVSVPHYDLEVCITK